ncbi:MAG: alpha/beta hydrolase [Gemmatimonadota bacterium]|nr:alpha/beta hydrolase [Gemmatimonadota bacterium]
MALFWQAWEAAGRRANLLFVHGVGEHSGRYGALASRLGERGIACAGFDHRGHGRSSGRRGHVDRWDRYLEDVAIALEAALPPAGRPRFVFGHSMGALIALSLALDGFAKRGGVDGWILSGAGIRPTGVAKPHLVAIARLLSRILPTIRIDLGIEAEALSHDVRVVRDYEGDSRIVERVTVRWGNEALKALTSIREGADRIDDPMLILHGGADPLAEAEGSRWLHRTVAGESELIVYEDALHEPHNDPEYADVAADVARWIDARGVKEAD